MWYNYQWGTTPVWQTPLKPLWCVCGLIRTVAASLYCVAGTGESRQTAAALLVDIPDFTIGLSDYQPHSLLDSFETAPLQACLYCRSSY